jgi:hypothetical protein
MIQEQGGNGNKISTFNMRNSDTIVLEWQKFGFYLSLDFGTDADEPVLALLCLLLLPLNHTCLQVPGRSARSSAFFSDCGRHRTDTVPSTSFLMDETEQGSFLNGQLHRF